MTCITMHHMIGLTISGLIFALMSSALEQTVEGTVKLDKMGGSLGGGSAAAGKSPEDSIPVIEIRGEGKPMTAAQIRALEEETEGKPLDIKIKNTWVPQKCPRKAKRKDFVTFQYKGYLEDGKKFDQTYGRQPIRVQLGVGMMMPGLDKGLKGMCDQELRKVTVPWRLAQRKKSKTWKFVPTEEHWISFDIEMLKVEPWTPELQHAFFDLNNDTQLTVTEVVKYMEKVRKEFGKHLPNEDLDQNLLAKYFVKYYDRDGDNKVSVQEYSAAMKEDIAKAKSFRWKPDGRNRDPGVMWVVDFNGDGTVDALELDAAPDIVERGESALKEFLEHQRDTYATKYNKSKDEL